MSPELIALLVGAGALGGFLAGLLGIGGGVIFGPVLFFLFSGIGIEDPLLTPLTLGSSLLCTLAASASAAVAQRSAGAVDRRTAAAAGGVAAAAVLAMTLGVTTQPWYDRRVFQVVLGVALLGAVARMVAPRRQSPAAQRRDAGLSTFGARRRPAFLAAIGAAAGALAAAAGVGGGIVLVPAFNGLVRLPLKVAAATSTASIVLITLTGVAVYAVRGLGAPGLPPGAVGYVDAPHALALALPAVVAARGGVAAAHRVNVRWVRWTFAALAAFVAVRLLWTALA